MKIALIPRASVPRCVVRDERTRLSGGVERAIDIRWAELTLAMRQCERVTNRHHEGHDEHEGNDAANE